MLVKIIVTYLIYTYLFLATFEGIKMTKDPPTMSLARTTSDEHLSLAATNPSMLPSMIQSVSPKNIVNLTRNVLNCCCCCCFILHNCF